MTPQYTKSVILTRMGIGVFDERWWEPRLRLLEIVTASSLARFRGRNFEWVILLDADIPRKIYGQIREIISRVGLEGYVNFVFLPDYSHLADYLDLALTAVSHPQQRIHVQLLDDDDAISPELHDIHLAAFDREFREIQVATSPIGLGIDTPELSVGALRAESYVLNTSFYGTSEQVSGLIRTRHTQWIKTAVSRGGRGLVLEAESANGPLWAYLYHRQGDGDYFARVNALKATGTYRPLKQDDLTGMGIDLKALKASVLDSSRAPDTLGLTWRRTQPQQMKLEDLRDLARAEKKRLVEINANLFSDEQKFFYVLMPLRNARRPAGRIAFKGVGSPASEIHLYVKGSRSDFKKHGSALCRSEDGRWGIAANFAKGRWRVQFKQFSKAELVNELQYNIVVE